MHRVARSLWVSMALLMASPALAVELNYQWKKGDVHRFQYEDDATFELQMPGMQMPGLGAGGMKSRMKVQSVFSQRVLSVRPDGTAEVDLTLEKLEFKQDGTRISMIDKIPPSARVVKAEVDRKGRAKFYRMVRIYVQEERVVVASQDLRSRLQVDGATGVTRSGSTAIAGDTRVEMVASFDPRTGTVTTSVTETKVPEKQPKKQPVMRAVEVKEEDPGVDVIPRQIFEMLRLPEGEVTPGGRYSMSSPFGQMEVRFSAVKNAVTRIHTTLNARQGPVPANGGRAMASARLEEEDTYEKEDDTDEKEDAEEGDAPGEDSEMGAGMAMGGLTGRAGMVTGLEGNPVSMGGMRMDVDVTSGFDVATGRLLGIEGTQSMELQMGIKTSSRFSLRRL